MNPAERKVAAKRPDVAAMLALLRVLKLAEDVLSDEEQRTEAQYGFYPELRRAIRKAHKALTVARMDYSTWKRRTVKP